MSSFVCIKGEWDDYRVPNYYAVKLIDFGNATYETDYHSRIINTRQYRAPEVILGMKNFFFEKQRNTSKQTTCNSLSVIFNVVF